MTTPKLDRAVLGLLLVSVLCLGASALACIFRGPSAPAPQEPDELGQEEEGFLGTALAAPPRELFPEPVHLQEIPLPAGIVPGFDVSFRGDNRKRYDAQEWLAAGFEGGRFRGAGRDLTHVVAGNDTYHDSAVFVGPFDGIVCLEDLTIHCARRKGVHVGLATRGVNSQGATVDLSPVLPRFRLMLRNVRVVADVPPASGDAVFSGTEGTAIPAGFVVQRPADGARYATTRAVTVSAGKAAVAVEAQVAGTAGETRAGVALAFVSQASGLVSVVTGSTGLVCSSSTVWGTFSYQADLDFRDVVYDLARSAEHGHYAHGYAQRGSSWVDVKVRAVGAEGSKHTARPAECHDVPGVLLYFKNVQVRNWEQRWSWRGGAGFTFQGIGGRSDVLVEDCVFTGVAASAVPGSPRCLMVDDGGDDYYDDQGREGGPGPANGSVVVRRCGFKAVGDQDYDAFFRVGTLRAWMKDPPVARSLTVEDSGLYGWHVLAQVAGCTQGVTVRRCNTTVIREWCAGHGYDVENEAQLAIFGAPLRPFSKGWP